MTNPINEIKKAFNSPTAGMVCLVGPTRSGKSSIWRELGLREFTVNDLSGMDLFVLECASIPQGVRVGVSTNDPIVAETFGNCGAPVVRL